MHVSRRQIFKFSTAAAAVTLASPVMASQASAATSKNHVELTPKNPELLKKISTVLDKFYYDGDTPKISLSNSELKNEYGFTNTEIENLNNILEGNYTEDPAYSPSNQGVVRSADGNRLLYMDKEFLVAGAGTVLFAAAQAGPAALMAAWTAFTATFSGPIAIGTAVLGATWFADFAVKITGAVAQGKGVGIYSKWGVPPLEVRIE